jgi:tetratricopeptide (TPR) repeat protein
MNLHRLFNEFNREKMSLVTAFLCLVIGVILPWYKVPEISLNNFQINLYIINYTGKTLAIIFVCMLTLFAIKFSSARIPRLIFWMSLFLILLFPYWVNHWFPSLNFLTTAYHQQKIAVIRHTEANFNQVQALWKKNITLSSSEPIYSIFPSLITHTRFFQISSYDEVIQKWFGYSNSFFEFSGKGWIMTTAGLIISLTGIYLGLGSQALNLLIRDIKIILLPIILVLVILLSYMILPNVINYNLDAKWARGEYKSIISTSKALLNFYPTLQGDIGFIKRFAGASFYGNEPNSVLINFAQGLESYGRQDLETAAQYFEKSLELEPNYFIIRGYLATTFVNLGVKAFNQRKFGEASDRFAKVLEIFPDHVEGLYDFMIATAVNGDFEKSALISQKIIENQKYFQLPNIGLVGQAYLHSAWSNYKNNDLNQAWLRYRQSIDKSTWK